MHAGCAVIFWAREQMLVGHVPMITSSFEVYCDGYAFHCDYSQYPRTCRIMYQAKGPDIDTITVAGK
jgi:hypothetical protein